MTSRATPVFLLIVGCMCAGSASTFIKLSGAQPVTAAFLRCVIALLPLGMLAFFEYVQARKVSQRALGFGLASGVFLGLDYMLFNQSIIDSGASIATVLIGAQIIVFPFLALLFDRVRIPAVFLLATPVMLAGLALTAGLGSTTAVGPHPVRGGIAGIVSGVLYAGYLYCNRVATLANPRRVFTPVALGTFSAALTTALVSPFVQPLVVVSLTPKAWVMLTVTALVGQFVAFVLIGYGTGHINPDTAAALLLLQPVTAVVLGFVVLGERPSILQFVGIVVTLATVGFITFRRRHPKL